MIIRRLAEVQASGRHIFGRNKTWDSARRPEILRFALDELVSDALDI